MTKVDFDGVAKTITVKAGVTNLGIRTDVYTAWIDWAAMNDHLKYLGAMRVTGLDPVSPNVYTGDVYFLTNGWKLLIDFTQTRVNGVLLSDDYESAYYTMGLVEQYPPTVSAMVTTVANVGTTPLTVDAIWTHTSRTLTSAGAGGGATMAEIEASTILAKANQIPTAVDVASAIRTELTPELTHVMTLNNNPGLTPSQATMLLEMYEILGLDPAKPLVVTDSSRTAGTITQSIATNTASTTVTRI